MDVLLSLHQASIYQRESLVLSDVSFELEKGAFVY